MKLKKEHVWPVIGIAAAVFSVWLLYRQLRDISFDDIVDSFYAIPPFDWFMCVVCTVVAFVALAGYDQLALQHLRKRISFLFVSATSFTTYALAHNIGASVVSGAVVRYRAYSSKNLSAPDIGMLVAFCSFTFALATIFLGGLVLLIKPELLSCFLPEAPHWMAYAVSAGLLVFVAVYMGGSTLRLKPLRIRLKPLRMRSIRLNYPRPKIALQQLIVGPLEIIGAAGIIYFALPAEANPGFILVLGIFLASFTAALLSHAPGGIGVLEVMFFLALPDIDPAGLLTALLVFRLFYFLLPLAISVVLVVLFERSQILENIKAQNAH